MFSLRSVDFDVRLYVSRSIDPRLDGPVLQGNPQKVGYHPRLGRGVFQNRSDCRLRLLSN